MKRAERYLPIDGAGSGRYLWSRSGAPIWPVRNKIELARLEEISRVFGARIEHVAARGRSPAVTSEEEVIGVGEEVEEATRLYAHLTERRFRIVRSAEKIFNYPSPAVIVLCYQQLNSVLLRRLATRNVVSAPGLICSSDPAALEGQVLVRAAAARLRGPLPVARLNLFPSPGLEISHLYRGTHLDSSDSGEQIKNALASRAGVLMLFNHSDGLDADLGPELALCPMNRAPEVHDPAKIPRCIGTGICYRRRKSVRDAWDSGELLPPEVIAARIFVWNSCRPLMLSANMTDPAWAIAQRLLDSASIGAIILPWDSVMGVPSLEQLCAELEGGGAAGDALAEFHRSDDAQRLGHWMVLFGDPRVRVRAATKTSLAAPRELEGRELGERVRVRRPQRFGSAGPELALWRACLQKGLGASGEERAGAAERALQSLRALETELSRGTARQTTSTEFREKLVDYLVQRDEIYDDWAPMASWDRELKQARTCRVCGELLKTLVGVFRLPQVGARHLTSCPGCDIVEDLPHDAELELISDTRKLRLVGPLPKGEWSGGVVSNMWGKTRRWRWPALAGGGPARTVLLPDGPPEYPMRVALFLVHGARVHLLITRIRGAYVHKS